jgi:hypothetical protein
VHDITLNIKICLGTWLIYLQYCDISWVFLTWKSLLSSRASLTASLYSDPLNTNCYCVVSPKKAHHFQNLVTNHLINKEAKAGELSRVRLNNYAHPWLWASLMARQPLTVWCTGWVLSPGPGSIPPRGHLVFLPFRRTGVVRCSLEYTSFSARAFSLAAAADVCQY